MSLTGSHNFKQDVYFMINYKLFSKHHQKLLTRKLSLTPKLEAESRFIGNGG